MRNQNIHYAELALIASVTGRGVDKSKEKTRIRRLYTEAFKIVFEKMARLTNNMSDMDINRAGGLFEEWANATGWGNKDRHDCTRISFALRLMEQSKFTYPRKLADILMDIIDYFERKNKMPSSSCWAGDLAGEKWESMIHDIQAGKRPIPVAITAKPKPLPRHLEPWELIIKEAS